MEAPNERLPLDYTPAWIRLGIVSTDDVQRDQHECSTGDDPHPEHYRWRAFSRFFATQLALPAALAHQLYILGATDADREVGGSIMAEVLRHRDCPLELLRSALCSDRAHLQRIANQRLNSTAERA